MGAAGLPRERSLTGMMDQAVVFADEGTPLPISRSAVVDALSLYLTSVCLVT